MPTNRIDAVSPDTRRATSKTGLGFMIEVLLFPNDLGFREHADMAKFGDKNRYLVVKAPAIAQTRPEILPGRFGRCRPNEEKRDPG